MPCESATVPAAVCFGSHLRQMPPHTHTKRTSVRGGHWFLPHQTHNSVRGVQKRVFALGQSFFATDGVHTIGKAVTRVRRVRRPATSQMGLLLRRMGGVRVDSWGENKSPTSEKTQSNRLRSQGKNRKREYLFYCLTN